jgi:hypothetical protein
MKYTVNVNLTDGHSIIKYATKKPYVTDSRLHIENALDEYTVIPMSQIRMYAVQLEQK